MVAPTFSMLHTKTKSQFGLKLVPEIFERFLPYMGLVAILVVGP